MFIYTDSKKIIFAVKEKGKLRVSESCETASGLALTSIALRSLRQFVEEEEGCGASEPHGTA